MFSFSQLSVLSNWGAFLTKNVIFKEEDKKKSTITNVLQMHNY